MLPARMRLEQTLSLQLVFIFVTLSPRGATRPGSASDGVLKAISAEIPTSPSLENSCRVIGCAEPNGRGQCHCSTTCITDNTSCCTDFNEFCMPPMKSFAIVAEPGRSNLVVFWLVAALIAGLTLVVALRFLKAVEPLEASETLDVLVTNLFTLKFKDPTTEENWLSYCQVMSLPKRAQLLGLVMAYLLFERAARVHDLLEVACFQPPDMDYGMNFVIANVIAAVVLLVGIIVCFRAPEEPVYMSMLIFLFAYIPATALTPFSASCYELKTFCSEDPVKLPDFHRVDCSMQGLKAVSLLMTWIILQPWLLPKYDYAPALFVWALGLYVGWSLAFELVTGEDVYDFKETAYRVGLLCGTIVIVAAKLFHLDRSRRLRYYKDLEQRAKSSQIHTLLSYMVPEHVIAPMLGESGDGSGQAIAQDISCVSIMFILIANFDQFADSMTPRRLLEFLNQQFTVMDQICKKHGVTKIETVGEEYVACVGCLPADMQTQEALGHEPLLERLVLAGDAILKAQTEKVMFKIGIHTGPIVAGVIGNKLPRYRLFGDTINSAARMMQKCAPGDMQFGQATFDALTPEYRELVSEPREVEMKGKGKVKAYTFKPEGSAVQPDVSLELCLPQGKSTGAVFRQVANLSHMDSLPLLPSKASAARSFEDAMLHVEGMDKQEAPQDFHTRIMPERAGFSPEKEYEWLQWHQEEIHNDKEVIILRRVIIFLIASGFELSWMIRWKVWMYQHDLYEPKYRWPVFVYCRGVVVLFGIAWCYLLPTFDWMKKHPSKLQGLAVVSAWISVLALFISYDAAMFSQNQKYRDYTDFAQQFRGQRDQVMCLNFVLLFHILLSSTNLLFYQSALLFVPYFLSVNLWSILAYSGLEEAGNDEQIPKIVRFLVGVQLCTIVMVAYDDERTSRARFKALEVVTNMKQRQERVLDTMMPALVAQELRNRQPGTPLPAHQYRHTMLAQSDLCGFTQLAATKTPAEVVQFMSDLFGAFDDLTDVHQVYKVETIGDAYIAGMAHQPLTQNYYPSNVVEFGLDMVRATLDWATSMGVNVTCRVGVHYGECIGGMVGDDMKRYHLFGQLLTILDTCEATSIEGRLQISKAAKEEVERQLRNDNFKPRGQLKFVERTEPDLRTSKGEVHTYEEVGGKTFLVDIDQEFHGHQLA